MQELQDEIGNKAAAGSLNASTEYPPLSGTMVNNDR